MARRAWLSSAFLVVMESSFITLIPLTLSWAVAQRNVRHWESPALLGTSGLVKVFGFPAGMGRPATGGPDRNRTAGIPACCRSGQVSAWTVRRPQVDMGAAICAM